MATSTPQSSESIRRYCPHLGMVTDRTVMLSVATPAHGCFAQHPPQTPSMSYQAQYCLTSNHTACSFYASSVVVQQPAGAGDSTRTKAMFSAGHRLSALSAAGQFFYRLPRVTVITLIGVLLLALYTLLSDWPMLGLGPADDPAQALQGVALTVTNEIITETLSLAVVVTATTTPTAPAVFQLQPTEAPSPVADDKTLFETPTPEPGGEVFYLSPSDGDAAWWSSENSRRSHLNDSFLYAGFSQNETYVSIIRLDLSKLQRGAKINQAQLRLTGLRQDRFDANVKAVWLVELLPESSLAQLGGADFLTIYSALSSITLEPLTAGELAQDKVNVWDLDPQARAWLEQQRLEGAEAIYVRIKASTANRETLFAWDSGIGPETAGKAPGLSLSLGPAPPTPPPLPTKPFVVATLTPIPANVLTVVAMAETATMVATATGTYTPVPFDIWTPTPYPENLETVQAVAFVKELPPVLLDTPTPANEAIATSNAMFATAVAKTTGTFTPVPPAYVTPMLILPSPPALNQGTEVARVLEATALAQSGEATFTPLPYNAVIAKYVWATPTSVNVATVAAQQLIDSVYGTPTALPWSVVVITPSPAPVTPTVTPLPLLLAVTDFTPTPVVGTPTVIPDVLPEFLHNKILFKTTRYGPEQIYAFDPTIGQLYQVTEPWIYPLAQKQVALSSDGKQEALVIADANRLLQIHTHSLEYGTTKQITAFGPSNANAAPTSYDPAWSPTTDLIAFVSTNSGNDEIYTVNSEGSVLNQLTMNQFEWDKHPTWSPDGGQIVFFSNRETGRRLLWIMEANGANQRNLSSTMPNPGNDQFEDWEPIWVH